MTSRDPGVLVGQRAHVTNACPGDPAPHHRSDEATLGRPVDAVKTAVTQAEAEAEAGLFPQGAVALGGQGEARGASSSKTGVAVGNPAGTPAAAGPPRGKPRPRWRARPRARPHTPAPPGRARARGWPGLGVSSWRFRARPPGGRRSADVPSRGGTGGVGVAPAQGVVQGAQAGLAGRAGHHQLLAGRYPAVVTTQVRKVSAGPGRAYRGTAGVADRSGIGCRRLPVIGYAAGVVDRAGQLRQRAGSLQGDGD